MSGIEAGNPEESTIFQGVNDTERYEYEHVVRKARNALFIAGGLMLLGDLFSYIISGISFSSTVVFIGLGIDIVILGLFIGLGLWSKKKPFTALLSGLILFALLQILIIISNPTNIFSGLIIKGIIVATLISGIKKAKRLQELNRIANY